jgi:hypothetical protein
LGVGCSATPTVTYQPAPSEDVKGLQKFVLSHSLIKVDYIRSENKVTGATEARGVSVLTVPTDASAGTKQPVTYALIPDSGFGVTTKLKVTYADNTRLITSVGVEVEDNRVKLIGQIASAVIAAAPFFLAGPPVSCDTCPNNLPFVIDPQEYMDSKKEWRETPSDPQWEYSLAIDPAPTDAVDADTFFRDRAKQTNVFPYSACHDAVLRLRKKMAPDKPQSFGMKLALRDKVMTIALPDKGKVDMHTQCGANVTSEKSDTSSTWSLIGEVIKQSVAIKKAYEKKNP